MRCDGDLQVVEKLAQVGEGVAAVSDAWDTLPLGLLQKGKLELQDIQLQDVRGEGRVRGQWDGLCLADGQQNKRVGSSIDIVRRQSSERSTVMSAHFHFIISQTYSTIFSTLFSDVN